MSDRISKCREIFTFLSNRDLIISKYKGTKVQIPGAVSFYWQPLFTILRTSEYASYFSPILAGFEHRNRKNCLKNHGLPDRAKTSIFVTSAPRASFWPSLTKFHFWQFPSLVDSKAKLVLIVYINYKSNFV